MDKFKKEYDSLISIKIEFTPKEKFHEVVLYENTKTNFGFMGIKTSTRNLIDSTMLSYLHILCDIHPDFHPVIRFANKDVEEKTTLVVFNFNKKHLKFIKKHTIKLSNLYQVKGKVTKIDFNENYNSVMGSGKLKEIENVNK